MGSQTMVWWAPFANTDNLDKGMDKWSHYSFVYDVITNPCPNFNGVLTKPPLELGRGCANASHNLAWMQLLSMS